MKTTQIGSDLNDTMNLPQLFNYLQTLARNNQNQITPPTSPPQQPQTVGGENTMARLRNQSQLELPNAFQISDQYFQFCFMFEKQMCEAFLLELSARTFYNPQSDVQRIPFDLRVLATLNFLMHGHSEHILPMDAFRSFSTSVLMRCVAKVCQEIVHFLTPSQVCFSRSDDELKSCKSNFLEKFNLPGVIGVLDCFFVRLKKLRPQHRELYVNRHGHTALNVQVSCDQNMRFLDVNARYSGTTADIYIWKRSHVRSMMQHQQAKDRRTWLVADRGYRLEGFLMNPYRCATTPTQLAVNARLKEVRGVLDKAVALLKARFLCLSSVLDFTHSNSANIVTACVTLHNYLITKGVPIAQNVSFHVPKRSQMKNAIYEDISREGRCNREFLENFLLNNSLQLASGTGQV